MAPDRRVRIVEYDSSWPRRFEEEKRRLLEALGDVVVEHIGSTSVPGLGAKPIIDIMVGVDGREAADRYQKTLEGIGYDDVTPQPGEEEWFYCLGRGSRELYYHVHLVIHGSSDWARHIRFRDYLRGHPERANLYNELKKRLAEDYGADRTGYTEAKTKFINETLSLEKE
ncbi:GrpB family protein [Candidatus Bathyarchaeota archaeon]|nr:GrpB family protein [Candidatus Bathyarchaeota archaeon]